MTILTVDAHERDQSGEFALWVAAAIVVLALHVGLAVAYLRLRPEPEARAEAPAFDVAFMPATPPQSADQPEPSPTKMDQPEEPPKDLPLPPVEEQPPPQPVQEEPPPTPQVEAMVPTEEPPPLAPAPPIPVQPELPPPPPVPEQATVVPVEKPPEVTVPEKPVVVPAPSPKVMHEEKVEEQEKIEKREKAEKREEKVEKRQLPPKSVASQGEKQMRVAAAPNLGAESEGARVGRESWLSQFAAQIRRAATYPSGSSGSGTAQVSVTVARSGRLVSRRLIASAGSPALDNAALAAIERAQPFPPFPASMPEAQVTKIVPMHLRPQ